MEYKKEHEEMARKIARQLLGRATEQEVEEIEAWKADSDRHERLYNELCRQQDFLRNEEALKTFSAEEGWERIAHRVEKSASLPIWGRKWLRYAAVALLCLACAATYYYIDSRQEVTNRMAYHIPPGTHSAHLTLDNGQMITLSTDGSVVFNELNGITIRQTPDGLRYIPTAPLTDTLIHNRISTLQGMEYQLMLADSTLIHLNAESALSYPVMFQGKERTVEMEGEAYFQVARNASQPFVVKTGDLLLRVLGTSFNVKAYPDESLVQITLESGTVEVNGQLLHPGEQFVYNRLQHTSSVAAVDTKQHVAWHEGHFLFRNERLEDILRTLARWYKFDYTFDDEAVKEVRIGAYFQRYNSMEPILNMLVKTNLVEVSQRKQTLHFASVE